MPSPCRDSAPQEGIHLLTPINEALLQLTRRAESNSPEKLVETFVQVGPLLPLLTTTDHQVFYGRRGTGKTHALMYLAETVRARGDITAYVDMRTVGSSVGMYADTSFPVPERATRLVLDTLGHIHDGVLRHVVDSNEFDLGDLGPTLDALADEIARVEIKGTIHRETSATDTGSLHSTSSFAAELGKEGPSVNISVGSEAGRSRALQVKQTESRPPDMGSSSFETFRGTDSVD